MKQGAGNLRIGRVKVTSDSGAFTGAALTKDQAAGTLYTNSYGSTDAYPFYYRGQEPDGEKRHIFDYGGGSIMIYASTNVSGQGVTIEVSKTGGFDLYSSTLVLDFEKAIVTTPSVKGTAVSFDVSIDSVQWTFDPGNLMNVRFAYTRVTE